MRKLAKDYSGSHDRLHVLVNNAGTILGKRNITPEGLEETFVANYLSHFLLTNLLLDLLKKSAPSRIVNVSSDAHFSGHMEFDDLQGERKYGAMNLILSIEARSGSIHLRACRETQWNRSYRECTTSWFGKDALGGQSGNPWNRDQIARPFMISPEKGAETPFISQAQRKSKASVASTLLRKRRRNPPKNLTGRTNPRSCGPLA